MPEKPTNTEDRPTMEVPTGEDRPTIEVSRPTMEVHPDSQGVQVYASLTPESLDSSPSISIDEMPSDGIKTFPMAFMTDKHGKPTSGPIPLLRQWDSGADQDPYNSRYSLIIGPSPDCGIHLDPDKYRTHIIIEPEHQLSAADTAGILELRNSLRANVQDILEWIEELINEKGETSKEVIQATRRLHSLVYFDKQNGIGFTRGLEPKIKNTLASITNEVKDEIEVVFEQIKDEDSLAKLALFNAAIASRRQQAKLQELLKKAASIHSTLLKAKSVDMSKLDTLKEMSETFPLVMNKELRTLMADSKYDICIKGDEVTIPGENITIIAAGSTKSWEDYFLEWEELFISTAKILAQEIRTGIATNPEKSLKVINEGIENNWFTYDQLQVTPEQLQLGSKIQQSIDEPIKNPDLTLLNQDKEAHIPPISSANTKWQNIAAVAGAITLVGAIAIQAARNWHTSTNPPETSNSRQSKESPANKSTTPAIPELAKNSQSIANNDDTIVAKCNIGPIMPSSCTVPAGCTWAGDGIMGSLIVTCETTEFRSKKPYRLYGGTENVAIQCSKKPKE